MDIKNRHFDVCIIGAGVAGASLATFLGKLGFQVIVIERFMNEMDRIVGELMQPGGVQKLRQLGLLEALEEIDTVPVSGYALYNGDQKFNIPYPDPNAVEKGYGFHNGRFIQRLRHLAKEQDNVTIIEGTVKDLISEDGVVKGVKYLPKGADQIVEQRAPLTVVSEGCHSVFRKELHQTKPEVKGYFIGLVLQDCQLPFPGHGHVILADTAPLLSYPISSSETRVLIDYPGEKPPGQKEEIRAYLDEFITPFIPESMMPSYKMAVEEGRFKSMPNQILPGNAVEKEGVVLIGDSLNMRHPLTGGGMTVALSDVLRLGNLLFEEDDKNKAVERFYTEREPEAATINILANALYEVFSHENLKDACFQYLQRGGNYSKEPISILSGVNKDKDLLLRHFFAVAFYGVRKKVISSPGPSGVKSSIDMITNAYKIIDPLVKVEFQHQKGERALYQQIARSLVS